MRVSIMFAPLVVVGLSSSALANDYAGDWGIDATVTAQVPNCQPLPGGTLSVKEDGTTIGTVYEGGNMVRFRGMLDQDGQGTLRASVGGNTVEVDTDLSMRRGTWSVSQGGCAGTATFTRQ